MTDEQISHAIVLLLERTKLLVEGAGAAAVAALLAGKVGGEGDGVRDPLRRQHRPDAADPGDAPRADAGGPLPRRPHAVRGPARRAGQAPQLVAAERANVVSVEHHREGMDIPIGQTEVELTLAMRDEAHCDELRATLAERGYPAERLS